MAESHIIFGLAAKRSELTGLIDHHRQEITPLIIDLMHIDAISMAANLALPADMYPGNNAIHYATHRVNCSSAVAPTDFTENAKLPIRTFPSLGVPTVCELWRRKESVGGKTQKTS
ncbi:MAG: hypothetical protein FWG01_02145 [Betaproteobacteria bacterium]|nr:hypothetical protein [Betaproteobacteria bacterium]